MADENAAAAAEIPVVLPPGNSASSKQKQYGAVMRLITTIMAGICGLDDSSPATDDQRFIEDVDSSLDGFLQYRGAHTAVRAKLTGKWRSKHDAVMQQPPVRAAWAATHLPNAQFMADQLIDTPANQNPVAPSDHQQFWLTYKTAFTRTSATPWHVLHRKWYHNESYSQGNMPVITYMEKKFRAVNQSFSRSATLM